MVSAEKYGDRCGQNQHALRADGQIDDATVTVGVSFVGGLGGVPDRKRHKHGGDDVYDRFGCVGEQRAAAGDRES